MKKLLFALCLLVLISALSAAYTLYRPYDTDNPKEITFEIPSGSTTKDIAEILKDSQLVRSGNLFMLLVKRSGNENNIKAGRYTLSQDMDYDQIISELVRGSSFVEFSRVTIPEGYELRQITELLVSKGLVEKEEFEKALDPSLYDYSFLETVDSDTLEGYLFPDTYDIPYSYGPQKIIEIFLDRFDEIFNETYRQRLSETGFSMNELVTMASIIERETKYPPERKTVSGVFHNRLDINMRLESCATVQYALGERKESLTYEDTSISSPYNTYRMKGLPPGPIASPGEESLVAALYPESNEYLFFYAIPGDEKGRHVFSKTYEEHLKAQLKYKD